MNKLKTGALLAALLGIVSTVATAANAQTNPQYTVLKKIVVGGDGGWDYLTMDADSHRLFLSRGTHVMVVDVTKDGKDAIVGDIPNTQGVHGIALDTKAGKGYTSNGRDNSVSVFDLKTYKETDRIKVGENPDAIIFDPATKRVFTFNGRSNDSSAIDVTTNKMVGTVALGGKPEFAVADGRGNIFVNIEDKNEIIEFDGKTMAVLHHYPIAPGEEASGLSIDLKRQRVFAVCHNEKMAILDCATGKIVASPAIGKGTDASAYDPGTSCAFSSNGEGTLTIVQVGDGDKYTVIDTLKTEPGARTMALDTKTHNVYLVTAKVDTTPAVPAAATPGAAQPRRNRFVPDSFTIVVVGLKK